MSQGYYQKQWESTQNYIKKNLAADAKIKKKGPYKDPNTAKRLVGRMFMNYVRIVNKLDECYDQLIHPQKREVISRLLDMSLGRLLELKSDLVRLELDDYVFFDDILIELKLTHQDMEIHVPKYFWQSREKAIAHRKGLIRQVFEEAEKEKFKEDYLQNFSLEEREKAWEEYLLSEEKARLEREKFEEQQRKMEIHTVVQVDSLEALKKDLKKEQKENKEEIVEAILLIQRHERARQGRIQAMLQKRSKILRLLAATAKKVPKEKAMEAAKVIQTHWRKYWARKKALRKNKMLQDMLGMTKIGFRDSTKIRALENVTKLRRKMQDRNQKEYEEAMVKVKEKVTALYTIPMEEDIVDEIMAWFKWHFEQSGYFPDFPPPDPIIPTGKILGIPKKLGPDFADKLEPPKKKKKGPPEKPQKMTALGIALAGIKEIGGSALVVGGHWLGPAEFLICQTELEKKGKSGDKGGEEKMKLTKEEIAEMKKKEKELQKKMLLAQEAAGFQLNESNFMMALSKADEDYRLEWLDRDERKNPEQRYVYDLVKNEKCYELSMEVRKTVDEMMELELENLKFAREKDKNPKKKRKKKKPKKPKKEKKKKAKKDPTADRTLDDLFMELFKNGIIRDYEEVYMKDYLGDRSYGAFDMRRRLVDWPPSTGDVRELILQICILPLGSWRIHQLSPLIKSVCLLGAENSAKSFLARIICTETASVVFDLSPSNLVGKYPGKDGLKMLQHLVEKMSRALQPSVILVEEAEKTFYKKVPKEEKELDPKRLAPMILKLVKGIKPEDQVLLLGVSSQPWLAKKKKFFKAYHKAIQLPQMDYGTYVGLWRDLLMPYHSVPGDFDVSCLSKVSQGYSAKAIMDTVKSVLTVNRISLSRNKPYTPEEFFNELLKIKPTDPKLHEKNLKFYSGLELPKKKAKKLKALQDEIERAKNKKKN